MENKEENNAVATPSYEDLTKQLDNMLKLIEENNVLKWSLTAMYKEMNNWKCQADMWKANYDNEHKRAEKLYDDVEELNCNTITGNFMDFEITSINSNPSKTIISCEGRSCFEGTSVTNTNKYDTEELIENCTVKIWSNSNTGDVKIGWWKNDK